MQNWQDKRQRVFMRKNSKNRALMSIAAIRRAFLVLTIWFGGSLSIAQAETYYLGVLAPQGEAVTQQIWQPWLDQLNQQLVDDTVVLVPLALENWQQQIKAQQFALVLGPQVQFIKMNTTRWRWLATLQTDNTAANLNNNNDTGVIGFNTQKMLSPSSTTVDLVNELNELNKLDALNQMQEPSAMEEVASALWVAADSDIHRLQDLHQRRIAAVDADAFGGYLLVAHLLQQNGIAPNRYQTQFVGYPVERTLDALASGEVSAAIAPLCLMEEMARQGKINKKQYRLIHPVATTSNCQSSTKIYPNWTLAATEQAPATLVHQINQNLFGAGASSSDQARLRQRWLPPESSIDAERILYEMNRHPAQKQLSSHIIDWIQSHRLWMGMIVFIVMISTINYGWMSWLAWRRRQKILTQNQLIRDYDQQLRQSERFAVIGEMSGSIAHEINQPLATIQNYAQGLLIRSQQARLNKVRSNENTEPDSDTTTENALQQIVTETERVAAVIGNIRHWAGRSQASEVNVDIAATYQQCVLLLGEKASGISFWLASDYQYLTLPKLLLDQLLINTVTNAQQQGATHIMLRCQAEAYAGKQWLVLHISDDAGGFEAAQLEARRSPQKSLHSYATKSTKADGLGLGLMICQRLCKSLGGMMQLSNVNVQHELDTIQMVDGSHQQRCKRSLNGKIQLVQSNTLYQPSNSTGAQVSFYLPLYVAKTNGKPQ